MWDDISGSGTAGNAGFYPSLENLSKPNEIMHYMGTTSTSLKVHPKASSDDYEALPSVNEYETPHFQISNTPYYYQVAVPSTSADDTECSTLDEALPFDEQIYEDPGHKEEKIYAWFEKKKVRKIRGNDIKYVGGMLLFMCCVEFYSNLDLENLEWLILPYGLMVLLILYK